MYIYPNFAIASGWFCATIWNKMSTEKTSIDYAPVILKGTRNGILEEYPSNCLYSAICMAQRWLDFDWMTAEEIVDANGKVLMAKYELTQVVEALPKPVMKTLGW